MAVAVIPKPTLWECYKQELFKGSRQMFYKVVLSVPIAIPLVIMVIQTGVKIFSEVETSVPDSSAFTNVMNLGLEGTFAISNRLMFVQLGGVYGVVVVIGVALSVANEYRWNTIKMLATRQPSRVKLVLSKCLFAVSLVFGAMLSVMVGWFLWAMYLKFFYSVSLEITQADLENMVRGLRYFMIVSLQTGVMALFAVAITFLFKSVVAGAIGFLVYSGLDSFVSVIGAQFGNGTLNNIPQWAMPFLRSARDMNAFLISSSTNRLTMLEQYFFLGRTISNPQIIVSNPMWLAWMVLVVYGLIFTILAVLFFALRDIRD
jgi:ABC-type transport system involved in multi-copper enzyme maturation permease subunit